MINENLIHFNKRKRIYFNKEKQKNVEMHLMYKLFKIKVVCICLQQQTKIQNVILKINIINIVEKLFKFKNKIDDKKKVYDENILMKVKIIC